MPDRSTFATRHFWIWPALVVLVWIALGAVTGPFAGRLAEVQENDNASFLPAEAESTSVAALQTELGGGDKLPTVLLWDYDSQVTAEQRDAVQEQLARVAEVEGVVPGSVTEATPSEDGTALQATVDVEGGDQEAAVVTVEELRELLGTQEASENGDVYVTGLGGLIADFGAAFGAIDGLLLAVALSVVLVILLVVYRSPVLPIVVLLSAILALGLASGVVYALASNDVITLNGQSQGILFILVVGAATDYALLLVSRFREELREYESKVDAFKVAYRGVLEPIVASGTTVILGLLCLLLSSLSSNQGLGPVGALGIAGAMLAALTFLPAVLLLLGRWAFWPFRPAYGSEHPEQRGIWGRVSRLVGRFPRRVWVLTVLALAVAAAFVPQFKDEGVPQNDTFLTTVESVEGQEAFAGKFPVGTADPTFVALQPDQVPAVLDVASGVEGVAPPQPAGDQGAGQPPVAEDGRTLLPLILQDAVDSPEAEATVERLRAAFDEAGLEDVEVGGNTAIALDVRDASTADRNLIIPVILLVIFVVLALLLRALLIPLLLVLANVLSFGATLGVSALVFNYIFDFPGGDPAVTLIAFVFLVALGIDYSIFLMTRVREESLELGTRPGILLGLSQTGGVITSAGVVLAATFSALGILPILFLAQIAFLVAFGVLLDTIVVRSLLVPALSHDIGSAIWWPSRLWRAEAQPGRRAPTHRAG